MNLQFFYLFWSSSFLLLWLFLFLWRKDARREMLLISIFFGLGGIASQKIHIQDWWQPLTVTGTSIGVEDFIIGFAIGGIAAVIYEAVLRKRVVHSTASCSRKRGSYFFLGSFGLAFLVSFQVLDLSSFYSAVLAYFLGISYVLFFRRDLIYNSILSGVLLLIMGMIAYYALFLFYPGYIKEFWYLPDTWYATLVLGIPIAEYIWYFLTGAFIGPVYEFIEGFRVRSMPK